MPADFNAFDSTGNAFRDSRYDARGRNALFFGAAQSGGAINFPPGILGDSLQFYAYSPTFPMPSFRWNGGLIGDADDGWGRRSFTIRYWWRAGSAANVGSSSPLGESIKGQFRTGYYDTFFIQPNLNRRKIDAPIGGATIVYIPTIRFAVWTGAAFEEVSLHFFQSPETSGGSTVGLPTGGIVGPLVEMTEDTWHRTIVWYDADALEIGIQLDDLTPETAILTGPIPGGATQGLLVGENTPFNNFDFGFDEYGLWHDYVWTALERSDDWNGGTGLGWPDVLSAISKQPMAYWRFEDPEDITAEGVASLV